MKNWLQENVDVTGKLNSEGDHWGMCSDKIKVSSVICTRKVPMAIKNGVWPTNDVTWYNCVAHACW